MCSDWPKVTKLETAGFTLRSPTAPFWPLLAQKGKVRTGTGLTRLLPGRAPPPAPASFTFWRELSLANVFTLSKVLRSLPAQRVP